MVKYRFVAGVKGRLGRQKQRKGIKLRDAGITVQTQERYYVAVREVKKFVEAAESYVALDEKIADWIQHKFEAGYPLNGVADCLSGIHYFLPQSRRQLPVAWKLFSVWRKIEVPSRAPPITEDLLLALASRALALNQLEFSCLLLVGFHCFLRTGELLSLTAESFLVNSKTGIVYLPSSKGETRRNTKEAVTIECPVIREVVSTLLDIRKLEGRQKLPLWLFSGSAFRKRFLDYLNHFDVLHLGFRCYSLRRGGATNDFQRHGLIERTLIRGRWSSTAIAKIYLCDGLAQLPSLKLRASTWATMKQFDMLSSSIAATRAKC